MKHSMVIYCGEEPEILRGIRMNPDETQYILASPDPEEEPMLCSPDEALMVLNMREGEGELEVAEVYSEPLCILCHQEDVVRLGETRYLVGPIAVFEIDDHGNAVGVTEQTYADFVNFDMHNRAMITVGRRRYPAFRLDD